MNRNVLTFLKLVAFLESSPSEAELKDIVENRSLVEWKRELALRQLIDIVDYSSPYDLSGWAYNVRQQAKSTKLWNTAEILHDTALQACHYQAELFIFSNSSCYPYFGG